MNGVHHSNAFQHGGVIAGVLVAGFGEPFGIIRAVFGGPAARQLAVDPRLVAGLVIGEVPGFMHGKQDHAGRGRENNLLTAVLVDNCSQDRFYSFLQPLRLADS